MGYRRELSIVLCVRAPWQNVVASVRSFCSPIGLGHRQSQRAGGFRTCSGAGLINSHTFFNSTFLVNRRFNYSFLSTNATQPIQLDCSTSGDQPKQRRPVIERLSKSSSGDRPKRSTPAPAKGQAGDSVKHCIDLVHKHDISNYVSVVLMPRIVQPHVFALLAFNVELALVRDQIKRGQSGTDTAGIFRLQFWRDALSAIYGRTNGVVPRQPVATALQLFGSEKDVEPLYGLVEARQQTLGDRPF